jgi:glycosyltransferase involved in cell wall biosynthesis/GT2 family glycosyltransferase
MKVILNVDAISAPLTGIGTYALHLARGLAAVSEVESLRLFSAYRWVDDVEQALRVNRHIATLRRVAPFKRLALEGYTALRSILFRRHAGALTDHVLHSPNFVLMPFDGPSVATVHDISYLRYPQYHPVERVRFLARHLPRTLERADALIVDSDCVREEMISVFGVDARKLHTVPLGVEARFHPRDATQLLPTLTALGLSPQGYFLVVATLEPRKNLVRLARAYAGLPAALRGRVPLVLVGARGWLDVELQGVLEPLERRGEVRRLGYLDDAALEAVYAGALVFALPSLYEGFGLPVLEAMASGVPVLTSAEGALAEVGGVAVLRVDPLDVEAIRAGLVRAAEDAEWRSSAVQQGLLLAKEFSWERCVQRTLQVYAAATETRAMAPVPSVPSAVSQQGAAARIGVVLVNYNTADRTLRCVESLQASAALLRLVIVDSGSRVEDMARLRAGLPDLWAQAELIASPVNIGFAAGCNRAIERLLADNAISHVLLLNNDAVAAPALHGWLAEFGSGKNTSDLAGGRVLKLQGDTVDSLGIAFYRSLLASNRLVPGEPFFGPTGGCAVYARRVLETLRSADGSVFDEEFFCYAEDTDVAARALLRGFVPSYCDAVLARHEGQASSGGGFNDFVLYHGIRNSVWMLVKCVPARLLLWHLPWLLTMHAGIMLRHGLRGKFGVVFRLYRDALAGLPRMWRKRRRIQARRRVAVAEFGARISPRFYDRGYLRNALRELWTGASPPQVGAQATSTQEAHEPPAGDAGR